jgi:hypothetical protein
MGEMMVGERRGEGDWGEGKGDGRESGLLIFSSTKIGLS